MPKKLIFALLPTILLLVGAEVALRWTGAAQRCPTYKSSILWVCDPILYFKNNPGQIIHGRHLNAAGFRGRPFTPKPPGVYRIIALGDSCTFGVISPGQKNSLHYVDQPYPERLDALAAEHLGPGKVEVLNAGVPGYNTYQGIMLLRTKLRGLSPNLITVRFAWDDMFMSPQRHIHNAFREPGSALGLALQGLLLRTAIYSFSQRLGMELRLRLSPPTAPSLPKAWHPNIPLPEYEHNLRRIAQIARDRGAAVWFLTVPHAFLTDEHRGRNEHFGPKSSGGILIALDSLHSFAHAIEILDTYNQATRQVAAELHAPLVDMEAVYRRHAAEHLFDAGDFVHPNQNGHDLEAETLWREYQKRVLRTKD